ncbi:hypothetical protein [Aestuariivirga sp.]|uniref:hypothetical protein n=1 Tax=Aestuariivirga sp. TaxID=2650926 RepID=UPI003593653C
MSQTETILLVILGFSLASLIALFIGRMMWGMAIRLGARRMRKQVPSSLVGLQTERDRLRADYAMMSQRLGSKLEAAQLKMAEQMAEVSRHRNRLENVDRAIAERDAEVNRLTQLAAELDRRLTESTAQQVDLRMALAAKEEALRKLHRPHTAEVWTSEPDEAPEPYQPPPPPSPPGDPEERLRQRIAKLNQMASVRARERADPAPRAPLPPDTMAYSAPQVAERLEHAERATGDLQKELEDLDAEWSRRIEELQPGQPVDGPTGPTAVANVISLANRIRDLKKGLNTNN